VVKAVQQTGLITVVDTAIFTQTGEEAHQEAVRAWLDFPQRIARIEGWLEGEPSSVSLVVDGTEVRYDMGRDQIDENPVRFFGMSPEEAVETLPGHLSNPALLGHLPVLSRP
jgi:hypothetical protein